MLTTRMESIIRFIYNLSVDNKNKAVQNETIYNHIFFLAFNYSRISFR